jgi:iron complex transport system substrate-binding protein
VQKRPGWASLRAVRTQRVCAFARSQGDILVRPGPRMVDAARIILECLKKHASA